MINIFQPSLGEEELAAVKEVFASNWIGRGEKTTQFESNLASVLNVSKDNVTSTSCCTNGLFALLKFLNFQSTDEVILPSISFVGAANAVKANGVNLVFADVDPLSFNITVETLKNVCTNNTKAVILIHYGGVPADLNEIISFCDSNDIIVIEDNACSPFSFYEGQSTGTIGDFGVWSFDSMKILCCGDGGLVYSKNPEDLSVIKNILYLGLDSDSGFSSKKGAWWEFSIKSFGDRHIMNDISSAIGLEQLKKVKGFISRRKEIHEMYDFHLRSTPLLLPPKIPASKNSSYYLYWVRTKDRNKLAYFLRENNIYTTFRYYPLHLIDEYGSTTSCPTSDMIGKETLCLPLHQNLSDLDVQFIVKTIKYFFK